MFNEKCWRFFKWKIKLRQKLKCRLPCPKRPEMNKSPQSGLSIRPRLADFELVTRTQKRCQRGKPGLKILATH
jgi:hypothetical protein